MCPMRRWRTADAAKEFGQRRPCLTGPDSLKELASLPEADIVLVAVSGIAGLVPTLEAINSGKTVALANKETLVAGGSLVMNAARRRGVQVIPVDSEHSAIHQCLMRGKKPGAGSEHLHPTSNHR